MLNKIYYKLKNRATLAYKLMAPIRLINSNGKWPRRKLFNVGFHTFERNDTARVFFVLKRSVSYHFPDKSGFPPVAG